MRVMALLKEKNNIKKFYIKNLEWLRQAGHTLANGNQP